MKDWERDAYNLFNRLQKQNFKILGSEVIRSVVGVTLRVYYELPKYNKKDGKK